MTEWREVSGVDGMYDVSDDGQVRSWVNRGRHGGRTSSPRELYPNTTPRGYKSVIVGKRGRVFVHRLVLEAFVGPCPDGFQCCHDNGRPGDNRLENLKWGSPKSNTDDRRRHGTLPLGSRHWHSKLSDGHAIVLRMVSALPPKERPTHAELGDIFGITKDNVGAILSGESRGNIYGAYGRKTLLSKAEERDCSTCGERFVARRNSGGGLRTTCRSACKNSAISRLKRSKYAKLTESDANLIRSKMGLVSSRKLASSYGVSDKLVRLIWSGEAWAASSK